MIEAHLVEDRGVEVANVMMVFGGSVAQWVCLTMAVAPLHTAASQPIEKPERVVITSDLVLADSLTAKFAAPNNQCLVWLNCVR